MEILELVQQYKDQKGEYIRLQEEQLYEQYQMTEENGKSEKDQTITHCFVTFKSMKGKKRCESDFFDSEALSKDDPVEMERIFMEKFLYIREAKPPGTIQWANVAYSYWNRTCRTIFIWILALIFIMLSFVFVLRFKASNDALTV